MLTERAFNIKIYKGSKKIIMERKIKLELPSDMQMLSVKIKKWMQIKTSTLIAMQ